MRYGIIVGIAALLSFVMGFFAGVVILEYATGYTINLEIASACIDNPIRGCLKR